MYCQTLPNTAASTQAEFSCTNYCALHENRISIAFISKYWSALAQNTHLIIPSDILVQLIVLMCLCLCVSDLVLQAGAEDQIVILHFTPLHQLHVFGLAVDGPHLTGHHADPGAQRQPGLILIAVAVTVEEQILHQDISLKAVWDFQCSRLTESDAQNQWLWCSVCRISRSDRWIGLEPLTDLIKQTFLLFIRSDAFSEAALKLPLWGKRSESLERSKQS